jgi:hypothetical protein
VAAEAIGEFRSAAIIAFFMLISEFIDSLLLPTDFPKAVNANLVLSASASILIEME